MIEKIGKQLTIVLESWIRDFCRIHSNQVPGGRKYVRKKLIRTSEFKKKKFRIGTKFYQTKFYRKSRLLKNEDQFERFSK